MDIQKMNKKGIAAGGLLALIIPLLVPILIMIGISGTGISLLFNNLPWYVYAGGIFLFLAWVFKR